ncbi:Eco57I restriction-modification methylase domain-containing protein [Salinigranum halophilum]|uniref:Eco57I restriction-modification methylase domain-containing protein n=1 Tax=Salinigranum halophilum TaxID=2565931 RepID=UPI00115F458E|nr:TaqI-like C-terminal specificity domain-containing protein [Salinigranum halophilum]
MSQATLGPTPYNNSNLFSGYYLEERVDDLDTWDCDEEAEVAFEELQRIWELEFELVESYKEDELLSSWIDEVLDVLGFGTLAETTLPEKGGYNDRLLFESDEVRRDASLRKRDGEVEAMYGLASAVLEAKQWGADFTKRFAETRSYRDASHQIKYYLEHTPERLQWGILTDGKKWRLYGTKDYATETYYEVDLPELLMSGDVEKFKYFYLFFRPEAFREVSGTSFLETVWNESETAAQELGEDLQDNVFTALRVLGEGFIETNDLSIDPDDAEAREELKEQSLVLLYRLMFVLYGESRNLISPDEPAKQREFEENFSLDELRYEIHDNISSGGSFEEYSEYSTSMWGRLQDLFRLVDSGEESLGVPPYNGGLFDGDSHSFLERNEVSDRYIAEVVYRLGTTRADDGDGFVLADYADLDTRHLGTIYEGLLEHEFRIAPEQYAAVAEDGRQVWKPATEVSVAEAVETVERGELYVVNDDGERKATGAYYTPDYVVAYIVEETIDPLLADIKEELQADGLEPSDREYFARFWQSVLDLTVLDPAMGSGHFLTKATGYLTERVMEVVREQEIQSYDEQDLRRQIAKECIYGVDVNGMAVELAKLSMWLETLAADKPLAFLDHHLKAGNSLVGSDITEVLSDDADEEGGQLTLMQAAARVRRRTLEHVMELMQDLLAIDNERLEDIKSMEELYDEIRDDPLYGRLFELANVHTAERFGLDVPEGVYEEMAGAIEDGDEWAEIRERDWFASAQATAGEEDFFHWELEYPEVFFGSEGKRREDAGFDAVIGNPPYVRIYGDTLPEDYVEYLREVYETAHMKFDLYVVFTQLGIELAQDGGTFSYIIPDKFTSTPYGEPLRNLILEETEILSILDLREREVFDGVTVSNLIPVLRRSSAARDSVEIRNLDGIDTIETTQLSLEAIVGDEDNSFRLGRSVEDFKLTESIRDQSIRFDSIFYTNWGLRTGTKEKTERFVVEESSDPRAKPMIRGKDIIERYQLRSPQEYIIYEKPELYNPMFEELFESDKIVFRKISGRGLMAVADESGYYCFSTLIPCVNIRHVANVSRSGIPEVTEESKSYQDMYYPLAVVNSTLMEWFYGVNLSDDLSVVPGHINELPIPAIEDINSEVDEEEYETRLDVVMAGVRDESELDTAMEAVHGLHSDRIYHDLLADLGREMMDMNTKHIELNLSLLDYLGTYDEGPTLVDVGFTQPPPNAAESVLQETTKEKPNLRIGRAEVHRESKSTVEIELTARYKPDDDTVDTDQWGYTETELLPALRITDLSATEAELIEAFVPVAVDEAGGFANFRETATKTNSLIDRLRKLTLPQISSVQDGLESYTKTRERADELESRIERTDDLIDEIVYELYGLSEQDIRTIEAAI